MQTKKILIGVISLIVLVIAGIGGYYFGQKSSANKPSKDIYSGSGAAAAVSRPANHSTIIAELEAKLRENPNDMAMTARLGDTYFDLRQFDKAVVYYKMLVDKGAAAVDTYNDIGLSFHYLGNPADGLKYIDQGIKLNPYHQRIWLTKGFVLAYGMGDLDGATESWEKSRALNPDTGVGKAAADYLAQTAKKK